MARTPKARALGAALRQTREDKGLLLRELALAINRDIGVLSRWENGERTPRPEQVAQILSTLGVSGETYDEIMTLAYRTDESQWVAITLPEQRQQMAAYVDWERNALQIMEVAPLLVPGLLQTEGYIWAMMTADGVPPEKIAPRVDARLTRSTIITKDRPAKLLVLLGQHVLRQDVGGPRVMLAQIQHLLAMATRRNIDVRVIPDHAGWHPGLEGAFTLIESRRTKSGAARPPTDTASIVFVETRRSILMLHEPSDVDAYRRAIDRITRISLTPDSSLSYIADLSQRLERQGSED